MPQAGAGDVEMRTKAPAQACPTCKLQFPPYSVLPGIPMKCPKCKAVFTAMNLGSAESASTPLVTVRSDAAAPISASESTRFPDALAPGPDSQDSGLASASVHTRPPWGPDRPPAKYNPDPLSEQPRVKIDVGRDADHIDIRQDRNAPMCFVGLCAKALHDYVAEAHVNLFRSAYQDLPAGVLIPLDSKYQAYSAVQVVIFVSHQWLDPVDPDAQGTQLAVVLNVLRAAFDHGDCDDDDTPRPGALHIVPVVTEGRLHLGSWARHCRRQHKTYAEFLSGVVLWYDNCVMPQAPLNQGEQKLFKWSLQHLPLLITWSFVLLIKGGGFDTRGWCTMEDWMAKVYSVAYTSVGEDKFALPVRPPPTSAFGAWWRKQLEQSGYTPKKYRIPSVLNRLRSRIATDATVVCTCPRDLWLVVDVARRAEATLDSNVFWMYGLVWFFIGLVVCIIIIAVEPDGTLEANWDAGIFPNGFKALFIGFAATMLDLLPCVFMTMPKFAKRCEQLLPRHIKPFKHKMPSHLLASTIGVHVHGALSGFTTDHLFQMWFPVFLVLIGALVASVYNWTPDTSHDDGDGDGDGDGVSTTAQPQATPTPAQLTAFGRKAGLVVVGVGCFMLLVNLFQILKARRAVEKENALIRQRIDQLEAAAVPISPSGPGQLDLLVSNTEGDTMPVTHSLITADRP